MAPPSTTTNWAPTAQLVGSTCLAVVLPVVALLLRRPDVLVLAAPFAVHAARGWLGRPEPTRWQVAQSARQLTEGESVDVTVSLPGTKAVVTTAFDPVALFQTRPLSAAVQADAAAGARTTHEPLRWGRHATGACEAAAEDPSGAWRAVVRLDPVTLLVRPQGSQMVGGSGVQQPLGLNGDHLSSVRGEGTEIAEVRPYRAGDRLRRITWRISSRTDELHVVDALTERDTDVLVVLDTQHPAQELGLLPDSSLDIAVRATTAITQHYLGFGDRVSVHDLGRRVGQLPLGSGPRQARMLHELVSHASRAQGVGEAAMHHVRGVRPGTLVFVCSPLLDDQATGEIARLRAMGAEVVVIDTLPPLLGAAGLATGMVRTTEAELRQLQTAAWTIRRLQRDHRIDELRRHGVAVTTWRGPTSLAAVLHAMEMADRAPRMVRR